MFILMVTVNALANILPINNRYTWEISDSYQNLFAPAWITFSIWWLIYLLLAIFCVWQFIVFSKNKDLLKDKLINKVNYLFIINSIANILWMFSWHYDYIWISVIIMIIILLSLIKIVNIIDTWELSKKEKTLLTIPFSVYFGWITVALIANITVFLVSINWNAWGIADYIWTCIILLVWIFIWIMVLNKYKNISYGLVLIWAYLWILLKHLSLDWFNGKYPSIIITIIICIILLILFIGKILYKKIL